jgi:DNA-directed RNA polymerase subunit alpha
VTASDIKTPTQLEVLSKNAHIASLTGKDSELNMEITVEKGLGYVFKENLHKERVEIGIIHLDALFTPVRRANYEVENMRVGDRTDYNRLRFFIETDGSISPREALEKSIDIMINHLRAIRGFQKEDFDFIEEGNEKKEGKGKGAGDDAEILKTRVEDLQISSRTINSLSAAGIRTVGGLVRKKEEDLLSIEGVGKKATQEIKKALGDYGLTLK